MQIKTKRLELVLQTRDDVERMIADMSENDRAQISDDWLARMREAEEGNPWAYAFRVRLVGSGAVVGVCSFKGPPSEGMVEIAYGTEPDHEGKGYATEAAEALVNFASSRDEVHLIRAHTLPDAPASKRVLTKCGFAYVGEHFDPEDGLVARFERVVGGV